MDFELKSLVTPDQQQRAPGVDEPKYKQYHQWKFDDGTKTRLAVDKNGIPLVIVCRNWLGMKAHVRLPFSPHVHLMQVRRTYSSTSS